MLTLKAAPQRSPLLPRACFSNSRVVGKQRYSCLQHTAQNRSASTTAASKEPGEHAQGGPWHMCGAPSSAGRASTPPACAGPGTPGRFGHPAAERPAARVQIPLPAGRRSLSGVHRGRLACPGP